MDNPKLTKFIKVSNNNNSHLDFHIDMTTMKDASLRISGLKSAYRKWVKDGSPRERFKEIYRWFGLDYSFYIIGKEILTREEALACRDTYYKHELLRMNPNLNFVELAEEYVEGNNPP